MQQVKLSLLGNRMFKKLQKSYAVFYGFFLLLWVFVQFTSGNLQLSFDINAKTPDAESYVESAKLLLNGSYPWFRAVGYPLLLAPFIHFFGENGTIIIFTLLQLMFWLITLRLLYHILLLLKIDAKIVILACIIASLTISNILTTNHLLTETSYSLLLVLSLYLLLRWLLNKNDKYIGFIFIVLAVSALIRPLGVNFYYLSFLILIISLWRKKMFLLPYFGISLLLFCTHLFLMKKHHNTYQVCLSKNHALHHYLYMKVINYPNMNASDYEPQFFANSAILDSQISGQSNFYAFRDSIYDEKNKQLFSKNRYATLKTMYVNFKDELWEGFSNHSLAKNWVYTISKWQHFIFIGSIPFLLLWFAILFITKKIRELNLLIWLTICFMIIGYVCLASSLVFWYGDRLHLPLYYILIMIFCFFFQISKPKYE